MDDDDISKVFAVIGAYAIGAIIIFMIICTVIQVGTWIHNSNSACEVTVQKE